MTVPHRRASVTSSHPPKKILGSKLLPMPSMPVRRRKIFSLLALFVLAVLSVIVFVQSSLDTSHTYHHIMRSLRRSATSHHRSKSGTHQHANALPPLQLTANEELASLIAFLSSELSSNALPDTIDPTQSLDPELVLDFDVRSEQSRQEIKTWVTDAWEANPVVLFVSAYSPISRELKVLIASYQLKPSPTIFEVDQRADAAVLEPTLYRLTSTTELPILVVGGEPLGPSLKDIQTLHTTGELRDKIRLAGAVVGGAKKKKGKGRR